MSLPPHHILSVDLRMHEVFLTFVGIYLVTMFKFVAGPLLGAAAGYSPWQIIGVSVLGMMSSVTLFTFLGKQIKKWISEQPDVLSLYKKYEFDEMKTMLMEWLYSQRK